MRDHTRRTTVPLNRKSPVMQAHDANAARRTAVERCNQKLKELIDKHVRDRNWNVLMHQARAAAEHGSKEFQLLRFPSDQVCSKGGCPLREVILPGMGDKEEDAPKQAFESLSW